MNRVWGARKLLKGACLLFTWLVLFVLSASAQVDRGAIAGRSYGLFRSRGPEGNRYGDQ